MEPTWHAPAAGDGRKACLPMVKAAQSPAQTVRAATAIGCAARAVCAVRPVRPVCADRASFPAVPAAPPAPSRRPDVRVERRMAPALAAKRVQ